MSLLLIDDQGEIWDGQSRKLRAAFDSPYSGGEFSSYAVINLGFVAINTYGPSCQIRLRPSIVTGQAHRALQGWLARMEIERVVLSSLDQDWSNELIRSSPVARERLDLLVTSARHTKPHDFLARPVTLAELPEQTPLGQLVRNWPAISGPNGQHALMELLQQTLGNRYVLVRKDPTLSKMVFQEFGEGLYANYDTWRTCAVGAPIEEQPDRNFGRWVAAAYHEASVAAVPAIHDVDAIMRWPHAGRTRIRYKRIIVPMAGTGDGRPQIMLGGSLIDNRIDLRIAVR